MRRLGGCIRLLVGRVLCEVRVGKYKQSLGKKLMTMAIDAPLGYSCEKTNQFPAHVLLLPENSERIMAKKTHAVSSGLYAIAYLELKGKDLSSLDTLQTEDVNRVFVAGRSTARHLSCSLVR